MASTIIPSCPQCGAPPSYCTCLGVGSSLAIGTGTISTSGLPGHSHTISSRGALSHVLPEKWVNPLTNTITDLGILCLRLRMHDPYRYDQLPGMEYLDVHRVDDSRVLIMCVVKGQQVTIEDGELFPSDQLITQLRLLMQDKTP